MRGSSTTRLCRPNVETKRFFVGRIAPVSDPSLRTGSPRSSRITFNVSADLHEQLRVWAGEEGRSVSNLCLQVIEAAVQLRQRRA